MSYKPWPFVVWSLLMHRKASSCWGSQVRLGSDLYTCQLHDESSLQSTNNKRKLDINNNKDNQRELFNYRENLL